MENTEINEKDIFRMAESKLYDYKYIDDKLSIIDFKLNDISISAVDYSKDKIGSTNAFNSAVENEVVRREEKIIKLEAEKKRLLYDQELINKVMRLLTVEEQKLIELRYFDKNKPSWRDVSIQLGMTVDNAQKIRKRVINNIKEYLL